MRASYGLMPASRGKRDDLHGNAPDQSPAALLIIDMINDLQFPDNQELVSVAVPLGKRVAELKRRCRAANIPAIYINDNVGKWRSDFAAVVQHCLADGSLGGEMVKQVLPEADDYLVLKPKHSVFYATPLDKLLQYIGVRSLIMVGVTTNSCILLSASDAYVRDYRLFIPSDCVVGQHQEEHRASLELMRNNFGADINSSGCLNIEDVLRRDNS